MLESLFQTYDSVIVLDTETTGVNCKSDEIIELGFLRLDRAGSARRKIILSASRRAAVCRRSSRSSPASVRTSFF